jgi:hypothetical protein
MTMCMSDGLDDDVAILLSQGSDIPKRVYVDHSQCDERA